MPKPDGSLYWYEKERLNEEAAPKAEKRKAKASPVEPVSIKSETAEESEAIHPRDYGKEKAKAGRRPGSGRLKATPETIEKILAGIRRGLTQDKALILAGISRQAMHRWKKANPALQQKFDEAETEAEALLVDAIVTATSTDWKAANWLLERRHQWIATSRQELTGKDGGPQLTIAKTLVGTMGVQGDAKSDKGGKVVPMEKAS